MRSSGLTEAFFYGLSRGRFLLLFIYFFPFRLAFLLQKKTDDALNE